MIRSLAAVVLVVAQVVLAPAPAGAEWQPVVKPPPPGGYWYTLACFDGSLDPAAVTSAPRSDAEVTVTVAGLMGCAGNYNTYDKRRFAVSVAAPEVMVVATPIFLRYSWPTPYDFHTSFPVGVGEVRKVCVSTAPIVALSCVTVSVAVDGSVAAEQLDVSHAPRVSVPVAPRELDPSPGCGTCWTEHP